MANLETFPWNILSNEEWGTYIIYHSSWITYLHSTICSSKTLQSFLYFMYKCNFIFFSTLWIPWSTFLCQHRVKMLQKMKNEKKKIMWVFLYYTYDIANFEAFHWNISMSANLLFLKNDNICSRYIGSFV